ncbi:hypothetical protein MKW92_031378 [Papaver armeniacum]|nr:hypothetical protein MKW92_031378 [Papaver armeniacum]
MLVPRGKTFLVGPIIFLGPCMTKIITVQISGAIVAPISPTEWGWPTEIIGKWIQFRHVHGLTVNGGGIINGRGNRWWDISCNNGNQKNGPGCSKMQPATINFLGTSYSKLKDITITNSPMFHITLLNVNNFIVHNIKVNSPEDSPNTDGLHTQNVNHVNITNSEFRSGDDCVSIGNNSSHVYIRDCHCGPGHGISIGSLGENGNIAHVKDIRVEGINFVGTMNGVRIKTWQGGSGECHSVSFKHSNFTNVRNPIIIDQHYFAKSTEEISVVKVSNITYEDLKGTTDISTPSAINLGCSRLVGCTGLKFKDIMLTPTKSSTELRSLCINAKGITWGRIQPPLSCLNH